MKSLVNIERWKRRILDRQPNGDFSPVWPDCIGLDELPEFNPKPDELAADGCRAEIEALRREIDRDNREIEHWTDLRDRHMAMLSAEEAKAKVLAAFSERTIEAGKMPMAAE